MSHSSNNVYDKTGPIQHAMGTVSGNQYVVAYGDTFTSIARRFNIDDWRKIPRANGLKDSDWVVAGTSIKIPGLGQKPPPPPPPSQPRLGIDSPRHKSSVDLHSVLSVRGSGGNLPGNRVVVRIYDNHSSEVARGETFLNASGKWKISFATGLPIVHNTWAKIEASSRDGNISSQIDVFFR